MLGINKTHNTGSTIKSVCHFITQSMNSRPGPPHTYLAITHTSQSSPVALRMSKGDSRPCGPDSRVPAVGLATLTLALLLQRIHTGAGLGWAELTGIIERKKSTTQLPIHLCTYYLWFLWIIPTAVERHSGVHPLVYDKINIAGSCLW